MGRDLDEEIRRRGLAALRRELGLAGMVRFLQQSKRRPPTSERDFCV